VKGELIPRDLPAHAAELLAERAVMTHHQKRAGIFPEGLLNGHTRGKIEMIRGFIKNDEGAGPEQSLCECQLAEFTRTQEFRGVHLVGLSIQPVKVGKKFAEVTTVE